MEVEPTYQSRHVLPLHPGLTHKKDWWPIYRNGRWYARDANGQTVGTDTYTGEFVRLWMRREYFKPEMNHDSIVAAYKSVADDGHTFATRPEWMMENNVDAAELEV